MALACRCTKGEIRAPQQSSAWETASWPGSGGNQNVAVATTRRANGPRPAGSRPSSKATFGEEIIPPMLSDAVRSGKMVLSALRSTYRSSSDCGIRSLSAFAVLRFSRLTRRPTSSVPRVDNGYTCRDKRRRIPRRYGESVDCRDRGDLTVGYGESHCRHQGVGCRGLQARCFTGLALLRGRFRVVGLWCMPPLQISRSSGGAGFSARRR